MATKVVVDGKNVFRVKAEEKVARRVGVAHRADYEALLRMGVVLAVDTGGEVFHLVKPVGAIHFVRKTCVRVLGLAPAKIVVSATKSGFVVQRV
ncbi:MAG: hypothetical protein NUV61_03280 [Candidatus Azambacteria bacterium]|nr:hypothetical protein [Candidatus Azambacteria bacterium]